VTKVTQRVDWWKWMILSLLICATLFIISSSCNPAILALNKFKNVVTDEILKQTDPTIHPFISEILKLFFKNLFFAEYVKAESLGIVYTFTVFILIPIISSIFYAIFGHLFFMIGGASGGWSMTFKSFSLHRVMCDGATLLIIIFVLSVVPNPSSGSLILFLLLPLIRFLSLIFLWINLMNVHSFGVVRLILLGIPHIIFASLFSIFISLLVACWFYVYLLIKSLH
jgi:hypothetical protein